MTEERLKEIKIKSVSQLLDYVETIEKAQDLVNYINELYNEVIRLRGRVIKK